MTRYRRVKLLNVSARRSNCFPVRPNGVTIRRRGTKAPVKTLEARDRCSPLTTWRMSRIAKGSYCRARCSQKQALAQIAKSGGLRFRSELLAIRFSGHTAGRFSTCSWSRSTSATCASRRQAMRRRCWPVSRKGCEWRPRRVVAEVARSLRGAIRTSRPPTLNR